MIRRLRPALAAVLALVALPATAELFAITNATVHTAGPAGVIARATVVVRNGHIEALGTGLPTPAGATVIDARGQPLTPGLIAARSHLGLVEITGVDETNDLASEQKRHSAALEVADALHAAPQLRLQSVQQALQLSAAHVANEGVQLIHHHRLYPRKDMSQFCTPPEQQRLQ